PSRAGPTLYATSWPATSSFMPAASTSWICTKRSGPPSSGRMKPNPRSGLKNLTRPLGMPLIPFNAQRPDPPLDTTGRDLSQRRQPQNGRHDQFYQRRGLPPVRCPPIHTQTKKAPAPPRVPGVHALLEHRDVLVVRHGTPPIGEQILALRAATPACPAGSIIGARGVQVIFPVRFVDIVVGHEARH